MDERPAPRFAVGQMVMGKTDNDVWHGPFRVVGREWGKVVSKGRAVGFGWGYWLDDPHPRGREMAAEPCLRPYDPPADQSYDELMAGLRDPDAVQRNLERDYLTEQYGEPV